MMREATKSMSNVGRKGRSFDRIKDPDLARLAEIAVEDRKQFFSDHPEWRSIYANRILCTALCQGAAEHYVNGLVGINDFDVYTFYAAHPARHWYAKRKKHWDFGDAKFGQSVDKPLLVGRRVDLMGRELLASPGDDPVVAVQRYLLTRQTKTARLLAHKAVVLLAPARFRGRVVWPIE
jgi:hypothetical protein